MKLLGRLLICSMPLTAMVYAEATQWTFLSSARDLSYAVDTDSVVTGPEGYVEYIAKTTWKAPAMLSGVAKPVSVSLTRYQIDCSHKQWRAVDTRYETADGEAAGKLQPAEPKWSAIGPGTVVDLMFRKVC